MDGPAQRSTSSRTGRGSTLSLVLLGVILIANGAFMTAAPFAWFQATPGVTETGPFNPHFVIDVGLVYLSLGLATLLAVRRPAWRGPLLLVGALWLGAHGLFHLVEWAVHGPPSGAALASEGIGVVAVGLWAVVAAWLSVRPSKEH